MKIRRMKSLGTTTPTMEIYVDGIGSTPSTKISIYINGLVIKHDKWTQSIPFQWISNNLSHPPRCFDRAWSSMQYPPNKQLRLTHPARCVRQSEKLDIFHSKIAPYQQYLGI